MMLKRDAVSTTPIIWKPAVSSRPAVLAGGAFPAVVDEQHFLIPAILC
jgi:hypothetical protein